nr:Chain A, Heterocyst differentiation control protein [Nostoc sp. PCC 7120 = FACHB-418]
DVPPERWDEAMQELDEIIRTWADKYHQVGGIPMILQMVFG